MHTITDRAARAMERLSQLAEIGADAERGGTTRPGLSVDEQRACELVAEWCEEEGLAVSWDAAGNLIARRPGGRDGIPEVWSGSHLDTVPGGGRFDGALGVLVALEAVAVLGSTPLAAPLAVVAFRDEEGWRFGRGFFGSRAVSGRVTEDELESADADGVRVRDALDELGLDGPPVAGPPPGTFVEVHVEQGPVLERTATGHAVVSSIAGMAGYTATIHGDSGHAGTTPMAGRRDAFLAAAELAIALRDAALAISGAVVTTGDVRIARPAANVVPGRVELRSTPGRRRTTVCRRCWTASRRVPRRPHHAPAAASISTGSGSAPRCGCPSASAQHWPMPRRRPGSLSPSCRPAPATTPACWPRPAWTPGCCSCAA